MLDSPKADQFPQEPSSLNAYAAETTIASPRVSRRETVGPSESSARRTGSFVSRKAKRRYVLVLSALVAIALACAAGILLWGNPMPFGSDGFFRIVNMRAATIVVIAIVVVCQTLATISFQTVTNNRIITPSIMGFESLYIAVQTSAVFFLGITGVTAVQGIGQYLLQVALMVGFSLALYGWLLSGKHGNIQVMLLVGIIIGGGLGSVSTFMQRLLSPSEFDVLSARLFGSIANADSSYFVVAIPLMLLSGGGLIYKCKKLNVVALGKDTTTNLGLNHKREVMQVLFLVSVLMAVTTSMVGPMTFLGFLIATLAYQLAGTYDHRFVFPIGIAAGFAILAGAYFVLKNIFYAEGAVSIIIEAVGGTAFLIMILRKGRL